MSIFVICCTMSISLNYDKWVARIVSIQILDKNYFYNTMSNLGQAQIVIYWKSCSCNALYCLIITNGFIKETKMFINRLPFISIKYKSYDQQQRVTDFQKLLDQCGIISHKKFRFPLLSSVIDILRFMSKLSKQKNVLCPFLWFAALYQ
jgi:hypothetical protein